MIFASRTDVGKVRKANEDSCYIPDAAEIDAGHLFFAVADGMGGHNAGEIASSLAVRGMLNYLRVPGRWADAFADPEALLHRAIDSVNKEIIMLGTYSDQCANMGTTLTCALCLVGRWCIGHVGDTRAYLIHGDAITQVTKDHSMVEEMVEQGLMEKDTPEYIMQRHILVRALGVRPDEPGDVYLIDAEEGDQLLICSDGLSENVTPEEIKDICCTHAPEEACEALRDLALYRGGSDNITVCICQYQEVPYDG